MKTHYEILGIGLTANQKDIKKAFRKMALKWHPDRNPNNVSEATEAFKKVNEAHEILGNINARKEYDESLKEETEGEASSFERARRSTNDDQDELLRSFVSVMGEFRKQQEKRQQLGKQLVSNVLQEKYNQVENLILQGAFLDELSSEGFACIHYAVAREKEQLLRLLLVAGAAVNSQAHNGKTALHYAVQKNSLRLCNLLLKYKAQTHLQDVENKDTPLHYAIENKRDLKIQKLLIAHTTTYRSILSLWFTPYSTLDCQDLLRDTPLHLAIKTYQFETVRLLINANAKTDLKNQDGDTALDLLKKTTSLPSNISEWLSNQKEQDTENKGCTIM